MKLNKVTEKTKRIISKTFFRRSKVSEINKLVKAQDQKISAIEQKLNEALILLARITLQVTNPQNLKEAEFKIFSQWGQDGIIQYLINKLDLKNSFFVEFGVQDYVESTTRFLLVNNNWSGLIMDGDLNHINTIKNSEIYWKHDLTAINEFITAENINQILLNNVPENKEVGLLVIDIDGNDYWVWKSIDVIKPIIVFCEFNATFGADQSVTVPYAADFFRTTQHYSNLYFGASLNAFNELAKSKGYSLIGCNTAGNDAIFVRSDRLGDLQSVTPMEAFNVAKFKESRDLKGNLTYLNGLNKLKEIKDMPLLNIKTQSVKKISEIYKL